MKKFKDLTLRGQKMRIVKDAIEQIKTCVVIPRTGVYLDNLEIKYDNFWESEVTGSLQKLLQRDDFTCEACAKGSLFAACVLNVNRVDVDADISNESFQKSKLKKWFSVEELDTIETAFECRVVMDDPYETTPTELGRKAIKFGKRYHTDKKRLLAILNNILKNRSFKP